MPWSRPSAKWAPKSDRRASLLFWTGCGFSIREAADTSRLVNIRAETVAYLSKCFCLVKRAQILKTSCPEQALEQVRKSLKDKLILESRYAVILHLQPLACLGRSVQEEVHARWRPEQLFYLLYSRIRFRQYISRFRNEPVDGEFFCQSTVHQPSTCTSRQCNESSA